MVTSKNAILHLDTTVLNHKISSMSHPLSKWEKGILLLPSSIGGNVRWVNSTRVACWSLFSMCGIHFVKTYTSLAGSERVKHACWGYFHSCCSHWAHHAAVVLEHSTNVTLVLSVIIADMPLKCIFAFSHPSPANSFCTMGMSAKLLIQGSVTCFPKQEVKLYHSANVGVQETSLVCCSAESERTEQQVKERTNGCFLPFPLLIAMWHSHTGKLWSNMVCEKFIIIGVFYISFDVVWTHHRTYCTTFILPVLKHVSMYYLTALNEQQML